MKKLSLKTKKRLKLAGIFVGTATLLCGFATYFHFSAKAKHTEATQKQLVIDNGYESVNARLKQNQVTALALKVAFKQMTPEEFFEEYNKIPNLSHQEFVRQYASAQVQQQYAAMVEQHKKLDIASKAISLPVMAAGALLCATSSISMYVPEDSKQQRKREHTCAL